jgi:SAM-dependent methyltransferase
VELEEYESMYKAEDRHWWYLGMAAITRGVLDRYVGRGKGLSILDAGCGTGAVMDYLRDYGMPTGIDSSPEALRFCSSRQLSRICQASITGLPFPDRTFDLITSFDVLSEAGPVKDEQGLDEFLRVLKADGHLLLRLPAYSWLHGGHHDERVHTRKRYTKGQLRKLLRQHGFEVTRLSYANTALFPLAVGKRLSERVLRPKRKGSDLTLSTGLMNSVFKALLSAEAPFVRTTSLPFGLTLVALARKPY